MAPVFGRDNEGTLGLIDDEDEELRAGKKSLERAGFAVQATSDEGSIGAVLRRATAGLVLDARVHNFNRESFNIAREYSSLHPGRPVFYTSNFFGTEKYEKVQWLISPMSPVIKIDKADLLDDGIGELIRAELEKAADALPQNFLGRPKIDRADPSPDVVHILATPPGEWFLLSHDEQDDLVDQVADELADYVRQIFNHSDASWIVVGGRDASVLRWSADQVSSPSDQFLEEIAAREGVVPFMFLRELQVDSIELSGGVPWPGSGTNRHYPALRVEFPDSELGQPVELLFDTGADANYLDRTVADGAGLPLGTMSRVGYRLGQRVSYRQRRYAINLIDGRGVASGESEIRVVKRWSSTIGVEKEAPGLLSNQVLVDLQVAVRICGRDRTVELYDVDDA